MSRFERLACLRIDATGAVELSPIEAKALSGKPHAKRKRTRRAVVGPDVAMPGFELAVADRAPEP